MDSTAVINLAPTAAAPTAATDAAMLSAVALAVDFAALLAQGLAPAAIAEQDMDRVLPATDTEDQTATTATDLLHPDLGALLLPDRLAVIQQPAAQQPSFGLMPPTLAAPASTESATDSAGDDGHISASMGAANRAAKFAAIDDRLPPDLAEATPTARTANAEPPPATTSGGPAPAPDVMVTGWSAPPSAITQPAASAIQRVNVPMSQPGWSDAFSSRVVWLAGQQQQSAELHVNPPELGPIDIVLSFDRDKAHVHFSSLHLTVREAIETALPALRDALGQAGIQLGDTSVSAESFGRPGESPDHSPAPHQNSGSDATGLAVAPDRPTAARIGLVDTFA